MNAENDVLERLQAEITYAQKPNASIKMVILTQSDAIALYDEITRLREIEPAGQRMAERWEKLLAVVKECGTTFEYAAKKCRETSGPCFCGCHTSETMTEVTSGGNMPETTTRRELPSFIPSYMHNVEFVQAATFLLSDNCAESSPVPGVAISLCSEHSGDPLRGIEQFGVNLRLLEALKLYQQLHSALNNIVVWGAVGVSPEIRTHLAEGMKKV